MAHRSATTRNEHRLAGHPSVHQHGVQSRERRDAQTGPGFAIRALWQGYGLVLRKAEELARCAMRPAPGGVPDPHTLADPFFRNAVTHRVDYARSIAVRNDTRKRHLLASQTHPRLHV